MSLHNYTIIPCKYRRLNSWEDPIMNKIKKTIETIKTLLVPIKEYYKSLSPAGKAIFIMVLIICKLGPDMILFPMLIKWINKRRDRKLEKAEEAFDEEIEEIIEEVDFK